MHPISLDLSNKKIVLVLPGIHVSTANAFKNCPIHEDAIPCSSVLEKPMPTWKDDLVNDFEATVFPLFPALGNIKSTLYKIGAIYAGGTMLVLSFIDNNNNYNLFLKELQYRQLYGKSDPANGLEQYDTNGLTLAKNIYKRNREVVIISLLGLYGLNVLDAYVTARLKYFNVDETLSIKLSPTLINSNTMYGFSNVTPALKLTLKL